MVKLFYEITYRYFRAPWDIGAREELVSLVESRRKAGQEGWLIADGP